MRQALAIQFDLARRNGAEPNAGRHLRRWFREAGFAEMRLTTSTESDAEADATRARAGDARRLVAAIRPRRRALECGIATRPDLESIAAACRAWGRDPDAFCLLLAHRGGGVATIETPRSRRGDECR